MRRAFAVGAVVVLVVAACGADVSESTSTTADAVDSTVSATGSKSTTSAAAKTTSTTTSTPGTTMPAIGGYTLVARYVGVDAYEFAWEWIGSFSIMDGNLVGSGTVTGGSDGLCGIEGDVTHPIAYTAIGEFDITGTADEATISVVLRPTSGAVDLTAGDLDQLCVEISADLAQSMLDLPLGDIETALLPIEVPRAGGATSLDFGEGFVIEVEVAAL